MVIFLVGLVSMILMRTLRKDYARYSKDDDLDDMVNLNTSCMIRTRIFLGVNFLGSVVFNKPYPNFSRIKMSSLYILYRPKSRTRYVFSSCV